MTKWIAAAVLFAASAASANPYAHLGFNSVYGGPAFRFGYTDGARPALVTPVLEHSSKDGYWLIPGVDWNLLNVGASADSQFGKGSILLGPSIDLGGPLNDLLLAGIKALPDSGNYGFFKAAVTNDGVKLFVMPAYELTYFRDAAGHRRAKGYFDGMVGLTKRWG